MPLPTRNPGALITTVGGVQSCRIALYVNSIAALQVRTAARQGEWWWETRARKFMSSGSNKVKDGRLVVAPPLFRAFRLGEFPDHPTSRSYIVDWPSALTKDKSAPSLYVVVLSAVLVVGTKMMQVTSGMAPRRSHRRGFTEQGQRPRGAKGTM